MRSLVVSSLAFVLACADPAPPLGVPDTWERIALEGEEDAWVVNAIVFDGDEDVHAFGAGPDGAHWHWRGEDVAPRTAGLFPISGAARRADGTIVVCGGTAGDGRLGRLAGDVVEPIGGAWEQRFLDCSGQFAVGELGQVAAWRDDGAELVHTGTSVDMLRGVWDDGDGAAWIASLGAILRWDSGEMAVEVYADNLGSGYYDIVADGDQVWAVSGEPYERVAHRDGQEWTAYDPFEIPANWYGAIAMRGNDDVWIGGPFVDVGHWDGAVWTQVQIPEELIAFHSDLIPEISALEIAPSGDVWIGGSDSDGAFLLRGRR